ncbi:YwmB family TATA-box binding protein [Lutispora thermophila]|uniref:TATA-box binding n=1 Tax=Lutispora thermophila DSM 19022 TaxID=1122184 RepID=A0A1M6AN59_9FIRM|nr:YwmB family TATA-box binding protein [Lutispora thermophila]SHI37944.1 TATA-box binding [Lutispora thermophila DSM 19022]
MKKKEAIIILTAILTFVSGLLCKDAIAISKNQEDISTFLEKSNIIIEESMLTGWNAVNERFMNQQEIDRKLDEITEILGFKKEVAIKEFDSKEDMNKGVLSISKNQSKYNITIESFRNNDNEEKTYISFMAIFKGSYKNLYDDKSYMEECFERIGLPMELDMVAIGNIPGRVSKEIMESTINNILNAFDAHEIESIRSKELISISAYSLKIDDYIISNGNKINMQIGMRYSQYYDKTFIWVGSPVIPFEY